MSPKAADVVAKPNRIRTGGPRFPKAYLGRKRRGVAATIDFAESTNQARIAKAFKQNRSSLNDDVPRGRLRISQGAVLGFAAQCGRRGCGFLL